MGISGSSESDGRVVATVVKVSSLGKGKGIPPNAQRSIVADEVVVLANRWWRVNGDGGGGSTVLYRNTIGDGRVVLTSGLRIIDGDGGVVPATVGRELMAARLAALADWGQNIAEEWRRDRGYNVD